MCVRATTHRLVVALEQHRDAAAAPATAGSHLAAPGRARPAAAQQFLLADAAADAPGRAADRTGESVQLYVR